MMPKKSYVVILSALLLTACGGGGGGAPALVRTTITGTTIPPTAPPSGAATASANVALPAFSSGTWPSIVQGADYTFVNTAPQAATPVLKVASINVRQVDTQTGSTGIATDAAYIFEPTIGQTAAIANTVGGISYGIGPTAQTPIPGVPIISGFAPALDSVYLTGPGGTTMTTLMAEYALPPSGLISPAGYTYQTFGYWASADAATFTASEFFFSAGIPTTAATLPTTGTADYTGHVIGSYIDAGTRDVASVSATMNATADFAALTVAFNTSGTNVFVGGMPTPNSGLDMGGTLSYAAGSNTFTGAVTTGNGMTGNATGRFYGPGIAAATATKVAGAPPEIGGTFAVTGTVGAMQGAFGGN